MKCPKILKHDPNQDYSEGDLEVPKTIQTLAQVSTPLRTLLKCPKLLKHDPNQDCSERDLEAPKTLQTSAQISLSLMASLKRPKLVKREHKSVLLGGRS